MFPRRGTQAFRRHSALLLSLLRRVAPLLRKGLHVFRLGCLLRSERFALFLARRSNRAQRWRAEQARQDMGVTEAQARQVEDEPSAPFPEEDSDPWEE